MSQPIEFYLSPNGQDTWSGCLPEPNPQGTDGPFATLERARDAVRALKEAGRLNQAVTVWIRGGRYPMRSPVVFEPQDSAPVTYAAYPEEQPVFDGGELLSGWGIETVNDRQAWVLDVPEVRAGRWNFRSLFVNGRRCPRSRLPKVGPEPANRNFYWMESVPGLSGPVQEMPDFRNGQTSFIAAPGDFRAWHNLADVEVVALHFWVEERMPVTAYDPHTRQVDSDHTSIFRLTDDFNEKFAKYYFENVFEGLSEPGEWYLDRSAGRLYYLPLPGETPETSQVFGPRLTGFLKLQGTEQPQAGEEACVSFLRFEGLTFQHADWDRPRGGWDLDMEHEGGRGQPERLYAASPQAAATVPGVIRLEMARHITFSDCTIRHIGGYGFELRRGCQGIQITGCEINDMGAGGVHASGAVPGEPIAGRTGNLTITDNTIAHGGRVFHSAIGILLRHAFGCKVRHNHIHDFYYSAISCGWVWGYRESVARDNLIEKNHLHHLGHGWLSDMGGIYTLGVQPGTVLRGNWIHDVESASYGGWGIYPDEGSSHILIENNLVHDTTQQAFHAHYGRENIVRNNIFAFGRLSQVALSRAEEHVAFTFQRNIVVTDGRPALQGGYGADLRNTPFLSDLNLFWDAAGNPPQMACLLREDSPRLSFEEWQALGQDTYSLTGDPRFADVAGRDFTLQAYSPALALGFRPLDLADVGPRPREKRDGI
jgi:hypothetical protein